MSAGICACGCGASLAGLRADALYQSEACKKRAQRAASRDKAGTDEQPLQLVREQRAIDKHNRDLGGLIEQAIVDRIKTTGECFADDLVDVYPPAEVDRCRELATARFGSLAASRGGREPLIREKGRRKSSIPSRKGAKSSVWEFTPAGRAHYGLSASPLVGSSSGTSGGTTVRSGEEQETVGVGIDHRGDGEGEGAAGRLAFMPSSVDVNSGDQHSDEDTEGNQSVSPTDSLDRPDGSPELPSDGAESIAVAGVGNPPRRKSAADSPPAVQEVAAGTGSPENPEPLRLDDARRRAPSMFDPFEGEAA